MEYIGALGAALWLGILTSISPCPLASNIAAVSFISRKISDIGQPLRAGLFYALGRSAAYVLIGWACVKALLNIPALSHSLQLYMPRVLGILLVLVGMVLLELITFKLPGDGAFTQKFGKKMENRGYAGAAALGFIFALAFCPVSAALFFASLIPLAVKYQSGLLMPAVFGVGTALPVIVFAILMSYSARAMAKAYEGVKVVEKWLRGVTGLVFILVGIYYILKYIFNVI